MQNNKYQIGNCDQRKQLIDSNNERIIIFESFTEKSLLTGHSGIVRGVDICKMRNLLATGSADNTVKLWNLQNTTVIKTYQYSGQVLGVVFSNQGNLLAFGGGGNNSLKLIDISYLDQEGIVSELCGHKHMINKLTFSNNSKYLISGSFDNTVRIWNVNSKSEIFQSDSQGSVNGVAISGDDTLIATNSADGKIRILNLQNQELMCSYTSNQKGSGIEFSHDQKMVVSSDEKGIIKLWSLVRIHQGQLLLIKRFNAASNCIWTVLFCSCSSFIISICNQDSEIKIIDPQTGEVVKLFQSKQKNNYEMVGVAMSKDIDIIAYGEDNNVVVWRKTIKLQ